MAESDLYYLEIDNDDGILSIYGYSKLRIENIMRWMICNPLVFPYRVRFNHFPGLDD